MTPLSQKSPTWKNNKLGTCSSETFGSAGCKLFSLCEEYDLDPIETNQLFIDKGVYVNGCLIDDTKAANVLGVEFNGKTTEYQNEPCMMETNHFKASGYPQHFVHWLGNGDIADPIDGQIKQNKYNIVSFRLFKPKEKECPMGFSDEHIKSLLETFVRATRLQLLGKYDEKGGEADVNFRLSQIKGGSVTAFAEQFSDYMKAKDLVWMKKTDCKPTVCPPCPPQTCPVPKEIEHTAGEYFALAFKKLFNKQTKR